MVQNLADAHHWESNTTQESSTSSRNPCSLLGGCISSLNDRRMDYRQYPKERHKTLLAFAFLAASVMTTTVALAFVHDRVPDRPPLQDSVFKLIPAFELGLPSSEYLIMCCVYPLILLLLLHRHRWIVFRRIFIILGVLYFGRAITMAVTALPVANRNFYCAPKQNSTTIGVILTRAFHVTSGFGLSINGKHIYCGDFIYSGHTCSLVLAYLTYSEYLPKTGRFSAIARAGFLVLSIAGVTLLTLSRIHYSLDVCIAYVVTTLVFHVYHTIAADPELKNPSANNHLSNLWFFRLISYAESNVPDGPLPVRYDCPLPRSWCGFSGLAMPVSPDEFKS